MVRLIAPALLLTLSLSASVAGIVMSPYLQALTPTSVCVLVECDSEDTVTVRYGVAGRHDLSARTESIAPTTASPPTYVHRVPLRGLTPGADYSYSAAQGDLFSPESHFRAGVLPGDSFRFAWVADDRSGPEIFDSVIVHVTAMHPLFGLYGGDLSPRPGYEEWKSGFFRPPQVALGASVPWVNAPGNHEKWGANTKAFTCGPAGSASEGFFSFDCGDMHVLVLNTELPAAAGSPQYAFAKADLRGTDRRWKIVTAHRHAYCAGGHGEDSSLIALCTAVFEPAGVDLVLAGHSHFYQHNLVNGIHHMVIGSAGAPLYDPARARYTLKSLKQYCWAIADVTPASLSLFVYNERGMPLDTLLLQK